MLDHDHAPDSLRPAARRPTFVQEALAHVDVLHHLARYLTGNEPDAEALVHATFARAFEAPVGGSGEGAAGTSLRAWLCWNLRDTFVTEWSRPLQGATGEDPPSGEIQVALMTLPEEERMVILLDLERLSEDEMAYALDCAAWTVPSRLSSSRAALRRKLAEVRHGTL